MIGIKLAPPWLPVHEQDGITVFRYPDGRFGVGVDKELKGLLFGRGERENIIVSWTTDYIEGPTLQSVLDRTWLVRKAYLEMEGKGHQVPKPPVVDHYEATELLRETTRKAPDIDWATRRDAWLRKQENGVHFTGHVDLHPETRISPAPTVKRIGRTRRG